MNFSAAAGLEDFQARLQAVVGSRFFAPAVNGLALLVLAAGLASWTWKLLKPVQAPSTAMTALAPSAPVLDMQPLLASGLFGTAEGGGVGNVPISSLNLVLTGVVAAGGSSYALISVDSQPQEPFAIGDEVTAGAVLDSVFPDRVILMRAGVAESLLLEGLAAPLDVAAPPRAAAAGSERYAEIVRNSPNQFYVPRSLVNDQLKKPQELLTQALMVPNSEGGYAVHEVQAGGAFEKLGLQVGDVVKSVNGQPLNSVNDAMRMYQQLRFLRDVRLEVVRGGQSETLQYNIN